MEMTVAKAVARFFVEQDSKVVFAVSGGASLHLIHAFSEIPAATVVPLNHEQSVGMAVDGYSRASGKVGIGIVTSGPGVTNLVTAIAGCFYNSVPAIFLAGQVSTWRMAGDLGVRQLGFQETPVEEILTAICKRVVKVRSGVGLDDALRGAFDEAISGRPGPVVIEVPDDVQREVMESKAERANVRPDSQQENQRFLPMDEVATLLVNAKRPIVVGGAGLLRSGAEAQFTQFLSESGLPAVLTWGAAGVLPSEHPSFFGYFGTHGDRHANLVIQNSDLVLSIGARLDTKATGTPADSFARQAEILVVDIDSTEVAKFERLGLENYRGIIVDANSFLSGLTGREWPAVDSEWEKYCNRVRDECRRFETESRSGPGINPYDFISELAVGAPENLDVIVDTGCALPYFMSSFALKGGARSFIDLNNSAMGWSIPATIGVSLAGSNRQSLTILGDGSLMMGMSDLVSLSRRVPSAKILLLDNSGHSMIRQTQDQWLGSKYFASSVESGLSFPDYATLAEASGFRYERVEENDDTGPVVERLWSSDTPTLLHLVIDSSWRVIPVARAGLPNEDMDPAMSRDLLSSMMLIPPYRSSLTELLGRDIH